MGEGLFSPPQRPVHGFDGQLTGMGRGVGLPTRNFPLAGLARREGDVNGVLNRLVDDFLPEAEERADTGRHRGTQVGDVIDFVLVQAHALH